MFWTQQKKIIHAIIILKKCFRFVRAVSALYVLSIENKFDLHLKNVIKKQKESRIGCQMTCFCDGNDITNMIAAANDSLKEENSV